MPSFSKPIKLFKGPFSLAVPKIPSFTSTSKNSQTNQDSPPDVRNFSPSPGKLIKMDVLNDPNQVMDTTSEEILRKKTEIRNNFLSNADHNSE